MWRRRQWLVVYKKRKVLQNDRKEYDVKRKGDDDEGKGGDTHSEI